MALCEGILYLFRAAFYLGTTGLVVKRNNCTGMDSSCSRTAEAYLGDIRLAGHELHEVMLLPNFEQGVQDAGRVLGQHIDRDLLEQRLHHLLQPHAN